MAGIADGFSTYSTPLGVLPLTQDSGLGSFQSEGSALSSVDSGSGSGKGWDIANNIVGILGNLANTAATITSTVKGNPVMSPTSVVQLPNLSGLSSLVSSGNSLGSSMPGVTGVLDYADSFLANSQTLNNATSSLGTSLGQQVGSRIKKYGVILAGLLVAVLLVVFFKSSRKKY